MFGCVSQYSTLSLSLLSRAFSLSLRVVTSIVSKMVWNEELAASLDQSSGVIVFHRIQLTSPQQLAQTIAEKIGNLVEQNEKTLDNKFGSNNVWSDRADGTKGEKRGEQVQERRGHGERTRGMRGTSLHLIFDLTSCQLNSNYRRYSRPWCAIFPRSGQSDARSDLSERMMNFFSLQCLSPIHLSRGKFLHYSSPLLFSSSSSLSVILATVQSVFSSFSFLKISMQDQ